MCDAGLSLLGEIRCQSLMRVKGKRASFSGNPRGITSEFRFSLLYRVITIEGLISLAIHCLFVRS